MINNDYDNYDHNYYTLLREMCTQQPSALHATATNFKDIACHIKARLLHDGNGKINWPLKADEITLSNMSKKDNDAVKQDLMELSKTYPYKYTIVSGQQQYTIYSTIDADVYTVITDIRILTTSPDMIITSVDNHIINMLVLSNNHDIAVTQDYTNYHTLFTNAIADYLNNC